MPKISIYSPTGLADESVGQTPIHSSTPLTGRRIAVLDNGKSGADTLLARMGEQLAARIRGEYVGIRRKGSAATPCEPGLLDALVGEADLVLTGTAD
ncbi:MAG: hypothetical protein GY910_07955 [bacterium]|nr:hypothetical protein [Deltaproteobacteria bacterium]MCP4904900.1 hypothetical protein [bacterium]